MLNSRMKTWSDMYANRSREQSKPPHKPCVIECTRAMPDDLVLCVEGFHFLSDSVGMYHNLGKFQLDDELTYMRYVSKTKTEKVRVAYTGFLTMYPSCAPNSKYTVELEDGAVKHIFCAGQSPVSAEFKELKSLWPPRAH